MTPSFRMFGIEFGPHGPPEDSSPGKERFDGLCAAADRVGIQWRDLVEDGYRAPGDLYLAGGRIRFDWDWRIAELGRRLGQARP